MRSGCLTTVLNRIIAYQQQLASCLFLTIQFNTCTPNSIKLLWYAPKKGGKLLTDIFSHCMLEPCLRCWPCTQCHSLHKRKPYWLRRMPLTMQPLLSLRLPSLNIHQEIDTSEYWLWGYFPGRAIGKRQGRKSASRTFSIDEEILVVQIVAGYACNSPYGIRKASLK